ncbi:hypothetical protein HOU02_gp168 [Caulobacter phage CcrBL9]|uniref:Uncharacterized protein n=1 Tax=Caulobacter phage CcrBL9 TaxID=2283270 RepID=A0A385EFJ7_9CAUD|nr:hypothetical protein HOU02_gp017 [Caulobacter phage CcrBL9]YP_009810187.1 hypothetical protein HOU02_gp168 [Caulobacter phage CcrBL9]AXQ69041.1 hypothetical protein CcrBL9_gp017 [Caulobacter phage CcrBL9]AXQ69557.1 hypothetical protein CcrBL9_gp533 [Caulobacter phage CcrBL9]
MAAFLINTDLNALVEDIAYDVEMEDRAAEELDGMDFGDRCYYGDRAYHGQLELARIIEAATAAHPILYA